MRGSPTTFWGKLNQSDDIQSHTQEWHPLLDHCADVAAVAEALLQQPLLRRRLARLGGRTELCPRQVARLCVLVAFHDLGKFNLGFQNKGFPGRNPRAGHVNEVASLFCGSGKHYDALLDALAIEPLLDWITGEDTLEHLLMASIGHHGKPVVPGNVDLVLWTPAHGLDPFAGIAALRSAVEEWFPAAFTVGGEPLPEAPAFQHGLSGLVTLADWLGSAREAEFFPFSAEGDAPRISFARQRAARALDRIGLAPQSARALLVEPPTFASVSSFAPRPAQRVTLSLPQAPEETLTVLEAETGSGKTEAALGRFLQLFHAGAVDGLYFALPTRTAATQIYKRVCEAVARAFHGAPEAPPVTLAVPGYLGVDGVEGRSLPGFEVLWNDDDKERFRFRGWAAESPKRYLAGAIVVGTIDQVLLSTLAVSHSHLRATALLRHLLVVDEVHASDAYMTRLLEAVLQRHLQAGGHALLMSATLGAQARFQLLARGGAVMLPSLEEAKRVPYPLLTHHTPAEDSLHAVESPEPPRSLSFAAKPWMESPQEVATAALDWARCGARVVILRNTVRDCVATQEALEALVPPEDAVLFRVGDVAAPHHARFSKEDRTALDEALEARFGKGSARRPSIVVATQTIQQSLDLDFDLMLTDLCPMDVLLQRAGRVHRHARPDRPAGLEQPTIWYLTPASRDLGACLRRDGTARGPAGIGSVYDDLRILEATWRLLEGPQPLRIPAQNRALIEESTHPEALAPIAGQDERWQKHHQKVSGVALAHQLQARGNLANWKAPLGDEESLFPGQTSEVAQRIQTRLGEGDRLIPFTTPPVGPFGNKVRQLVLSAHLARGVSADAVPAAVQQEAGGFSFSFGVLGLRYDRHGLRLAPSTSE